MTREWLTLSACVEFSEPIAGPAPRDQKLPTFTSQDVRKTRVEPIEGEDYSQSLRVGFGESHETEHTNQSIVDSVVEFLDSV